MKKILPIIAILLIGIAVYFLLFNKSENSTYAYPERAFAVEDTSKVNKIFIADKADQEILLEKDEKGQWYVNRKYKVRPRSMELLLETIKNVRIEHPVANAATNNVIKNLATKGKKVEIYTADSEMPFKTYFIGSTPIDNIGNYALIDGADKPFVVNIAGFVGYISGRFILDEEQWRSRMVFNHRPEQIQKINVYYPHFPERSFMIQRSKTNQFSITAHEQKKPKAIKTAVALNYLQAYRALGVETFANDFTRKDSLLNAKPFAIVNLTDHKNEVTQLTAFYVPYNKRSKGKTKKDKDGNVYDVDKYYAVLNTEKDVAVIQQYVFGKIFTSYQKLTSL